MRALTSLLVVAASCAFITWAEGWNSQSRWALSAALARKGTTAVDEFIGESRDVAVWRGHLYAAKAPGLGILGAPLVWVADRIAPSPTPRSEAVKRWVVRVCLVSLPAGLICGALWSAGPLGPLAAVACCAGTCVLPYATLLYGHVPSACAVVLSWRALTRGRTVAAGLWAGTAVAVDYLAAVAVAGLFLEGLASRRRVWPMALGMVPGLLVVAGYNVVSFGTPWATGYEHLADDEFARVASHGVVGLGLPRPATLARMLVGTYRGLLVHSPWLVWWPVGVARRKGSSVWMTGAVPLLFLVLLSGFTVWWGGASCGVRHAIVVVPLMAWGVASLPGTWAPAVGALALPSSLVHWAFAATSPEVPEDVAFPLRDFVWKRVRAGRFRETVLGAEGWGQAGGLACSLVCLVTAWVLAWRCCTGRERVFSTGTTADRSRS